MWYFPIFNISVQADYVILGSDYYLSFYDILYISSTVVKEKEDTISSKFSFIALLNRKNIPSKEPNVMKPNFLLPRFLKLLNQLTTYWSHIAFYGYGPIGPVPGNNDHFLFTSRVVPITEHRTYYVH